MSDRHGRLLRPVMIVGIVFRGEFNSKRPGINTRSDYRRIILDTGIQVEDFVFANLPHALARWDPNKRISEQIHGPLTRFMPSSPNELVPYDCSENGEYGDVKSGGRAYGNYPVVGDVLEVPCSTAQRINCRFYYVLIHKKFRQEHSDRYVFRIYRCIPA